MTSSGRHGPPHDEVRDRAVFHGGAQLLLGQLLLQAEGDLGSRSRIEDVPGFGLAVGEPYRLRIGIVRMDLDGKWLAREQQLEQERRTLESAVRAAHTKFHRCGTPSWAALLQGVKSTTPQGLGKACTCARSIAMMLHLWCTVEKSGIVTPMV